MHEYRVKRTARSRAAERPTVATAEAIARLFAVRQLHDDREHFFVAHLNARCEVIAVEVAAIGTLCGVEVGPREVFRAAIIAGSASIVVGHNHPSGDPSPSRDDDELTRRLAEVGSIVGVPVADHVIVGANGRYYSYLERGKI